MFNHVYTSLFSKRKREFEMRRLPVYILLDCSESMVCDAINSVQTGLETLLGSLRSDPHALETAWVSIITFSEVAEQIVPLKEITEIQTPKLVPRPGTALGKAFSFEKLHRRGSPHVVTGAKSRLSPTGLSAYRRTTD